MKAAVLNGYDKKGAALELKDVPEPAVGAHDVLVKVTYAAVNPLDNMIVRGEVKLIVPYRTPLVMGNEFAGVVERVGTSVEGFAPGDRVFARMPLAHIGAFAEYVSIDAAALAKVPVYLSDEEAACVPLTALTALQSFELMEVSAGEHIFISGGTGSLGAMAIPLAKSLGLVVATNGSARNEERVRALGADEFIDYKTQDYTEVLHDMDAVLDSLGERELPHEFSVLKEGGTLVSLRGLPNGEFARRMGMGAVKRLMFGAAGRKYDKMAARRGQRYRFVFVHEDGAQLQRAADALAEREVRPSVDEVFTLDQVNAAMAKVAAGGSKGKTILRLS